jgi:hypothetical protein
MIGRPRIRVLLLVALFLPTLIASGCSLTEGRQANEEQLSFQFVLPESWRVVNADHTGRITQMDTNGDGIDEWIILYAFDAPSDDAFTPVRCAIYHTVEREPRLPIIYPYHLQAPGWTYLGEGAGRVSIGVKDVINGIEPDAGFPEYAYIAEDEVVVASKDANDRVTRLSIFQWRDTVPEDYRKRTDPKEHIVQPNDLIGTNSQWYQCMGLFEGTVEVQLEVNKVTVRDRINDRSQLARVNTYKPTAGMDGYLYGGQDLVPPVSSCLDFAFGLPADVTQSPFPEKIVMAFHQQFGSQESDYGAIYLTEDAKSARQTDPDWVLFDQRQPVVRDVCITQLRYGHELETEIKSFDASVQSQEAGQKPVPIMTQVETRAEYYIVGQTPRTTTVVWELVKTDDVWQINDILSIETEN